jgi:hypothetical protein
MKIEVIPGALTKQEVDLLMSQVDPKNTATPMTYFDNVERNYGLKKVKCIDNPIVQDLIKRTGLYDVQGASVLYYPTGSFNAQHSDNALINNGVVTKIKEWTRTAVVFLNNSYTGGELVYPEQGCTFTPTIGTMVIASADYEYKHLVKPVLTGERFTLVLRIV